MKKRNIIKENREYNRIIRNLKPIYYKDYIIYLERNTNTIYKFGFSVGKKIGNAVVRNKIKRQIKNILDENTYQNNFNCIIIVKKSLLNKSFSERKEELLKIVQNLELTCERK